MEHPSPDAESVEARAGSRPEGRAGCRRDDRRADRPLPDRRARCPQRPDGVPPPGSPEAAFQAFYVAFETGAEVTAKTAEASQPREHTDQAEPNSWSLFAGNASCARWHSSQAVCITKGQMSPSLRRSKFVLVVAAVLLWGCSSSRPTPSPTQVPGPASPTASLAASAAAPAAVPPPSPFATEAPIEPSITDGGGDLHVDPLLNTVVVTVSDRVRVRSEPRVSADSIKYEPVLPLGTELTVLDGPVSASGYTWYQVAPVSFDGLEGPGYGWVALAGTDGEPWIAICPPRPDLAALRSTYSGLACYGGQEITFTARLAVYDGLICDDQPAVEPWWIEPPWLGGSCSFYSYSSAVFLSPLEGEPNYGFGVTLYPTIDLTTLPALFDDLGNSIWTVVEVTGQYDHPEARTCRGKSVPDGEQPPTPEAVVAYCRSQFVVTSVRFPAPFPTPTPSPTPAERLALFHDGSFSCEGGALAGYGVAGDGFAIINATSSGDLIAQVMLRGGLANTTYTVQLIQSAGLGGSVEDCFVEDAALITDSRGEGYARVREARHPGTIGAFVYLVHLGDATGPQDLHGTQLIPVGSTP